MKNKDNHPQTLLNNGFYLTDGGLETTLIFHHGIDLPYFASFDLLNTPTHRNTIADYYRQYLDLAVQYQTSFVLESATWRANRDWAYKMGYSENDLAKLNHFAIEELKELKEEYQNKLHSILISGCIGPRSDGYKPEFMMTAEEARDYHHFQIKTLAEAGVDMVSGITLNYEEEALGVVLTAKENGVPVVISFTVETDGNLPDGTTLQDAIERIDQKTESYTSYYMINCAHPEHFFDKVNNNGSWINRISGIRANASCRSHAELDEATELDMGDKTALANWYYRLSEVLPNLQIYGGCCGTDASHIKAICQAMEESFNAKEPTFYKNSTYNIT